MTPEARARQVIDEKLKTSGWTVQDMKELNPSASIGVAVREFPTSTGPVDYALFVEGVPVGVIEAKKSDAGENILGIGHGVVFSQSDSPQQPGWYGLHGYSALLP